MRMPGALRHSMTLVSIQPLSHSSAGCLPSRSKTREPYSHVPAFSSQAQLSNLPVRFLSPSTPIVALNLMTDPSIRHDILRREREVLGRQAGQDIQSQQVNSTERKDICGWYVMFTSVQIENDLILSP